MRQINPSDRLFVHVMNLGNTILNRQVTGMTGYGDVIRSISGHITESGLMRVSVRNRTQGWAEQRSVYFGI